MVHCIVHVTMITNSYPPGFTGGAELYAHRLATAIAARGNEVGAITDAGPGGDLTPYELDGIPVRRIPGVTNGFAARFLYNVNPRPFFHDLGKGDIAHLHNFSPFSGLLPWAIRRAGGYHAIVWTAHDYLAVCPKQILVTSWKSICAGPGVDCPRCQSAGEKVKAGVNQRFFLPNIDRIIAPSRFLAKVLEMGGADPDRIRTVTNGIDTQQFQPRSRKEDARPTVLFVGTLRPHKGPQTLLRAFAIVRRSLPTARLLLVGQGPELPSLERLAAKLKLGDGFQHVANAPDMRNLYGEAHAVVLPSEWPENCSLVILEAMASGRPVVATRVGGNPELIEDGTTGALVPPADPEALAESLLRILEDPARQAMMETAARAHAEERFALPAHVDRILAIYKELV